MTQSSVLSKLVQFTHITDEVLWTEPPVPRSHGCLDANILLFFSKNSDFSAIRIKFLSFFELFEKTKLLRYKSQLKIELSSPFKPFILTGQSKICLNACDFGLKFLSDLAKGVGGWSPPFIATTERKVILPKCDVALTTQTLDCRVTRK